MALILLTRFNVFIPIKYFPPENIFDFGFYVDRLKEYIIGKNCLAAGDLTMFSYFLDKSAAAVFNINVFLVILFIYFVHSFRILISLAISYAKLIICAGLAITGGVLAGCAISALLGFSVVFPAKQVIVIIIFVFAFALVTINEKNHESELKNAENDTWIGF